LNGAAESTTRDADGAAIAAAARAGEPDRYLAALLAPPAQRHALLALAAFAAELARIPLLVVREPAMGEIRLQWWRDALELPQGLRTGHAVADAVRAAAQTHHLPAALLEGLTEARATQLSSDPLPNEEALHAYLWKTEGALFALSARVLGLAENAETEAACRASGHAYGLARLLLDLPRSLAQGRIPLAQTHLAAAGIAAQELLAGEGGAKLASLVHALQAQIRGSLATARQFATRLPRPGRVAFLPLALVGPYLRAFERSGRAPLREEARVAPLTRVCRIAVAHLFGRL
jgi:phytoene synthase